MRNGSLGLANFNRLDALPDHYVIAVATRSDGYIAYLCIPKNARMRTPEQQWSVMKRAVIFSGCRKLSIAAFRKHVRHSVKVRRYSKGCARETMAILDYFDATLKATWTL